MVAFIEIKSQLSVSLLEFYSDKTTKCSVIGGITNFCLDGEGCIINLGEVGIHNSLLV